MQTAKAKKTSASTHARLERLAALMGQMARMIPQFMRSCQDSNAGFELTHHQFLLLGLLETQGPMNMATLRKHVGGAQSTTSEMISRLDRLGYIQKETDPSDSRAVLVGTTAKGRKVLRARKEFGLGRYRAVLEALSPEDQERFVEASETMVELMMAAQGRQAGSDDDA